MTLMTDICLARDTVGFPGIRHSPPSTPVANKEVVLASRPILEKMVLPNQSHDFADQICGTHGA